MREYAEDSSSNSVVLDGPPTVRNGPTLSPPSCLLFPSVPGYQIESELGRGGMGVVYRARQLALDRTVALKMLLIGPQADVATLTRFWVETQTVAKLQHRNIVQVYDSGNHRDLSYCALELLPGGSLRQRMVGEVWKPAVSAELVRTLARAVHVAHEAGVVHRDLKPANVLFDAEGQPKITDFGVAKDLLNPTCGFTLTGEIVGTPAYMAPEQADGTQKNVGPAADIYALGVILHELLTGQIPFNGNDPVDLLMRVRFSEPLPLRKHAPGVPIDLEVICLKCLEKDPRKRYASAEALADDLQRFLEQRPIQARRVNELERVIRWCRRNPYVAALLAVVVSIFFASFMLVTWSYLRAEHARGEEADQREKAQKRELAERWERYRANILAASSALQLHNISTARRLLEAAPDEHRNWEWEVLHQQLDVSSFSRRGSIDRDDRISSLVEPGGTAQFWESFTGKELRLHPDGPADLQRVVLSPDGTLAAYEKEKGTVVLWNTVNHRVHAVLPGHQGHAGIFRFRHDGAQLITSGGDANLRVWDVASGELLLTLKGHTDGITTAVFSPDKKLIASTSSFDKTAKIWDATTGKLLHTLRDDRDDALTAMHGIAINARGDRVITVNVDYPNTTALLWDAITGKRVAVLDRHQNRLTGFEFSPAGDRLLTCSFDQSVRLWDSNTGAHLSVLRGHSGMIFGAAYNHDGTRIMSYSQDRTIRIWDAEYGAPLAILHGHTGDITKAAYSRDSKTIISHAADGTMRRWDALAAEHRGVLRGHTNYVYSAAFLPDGERVVSVSWDGTARLWRVKTSKCERIYDHGKTIVSSIAVHPDGRRFATLSRDDSIRLWDIESGKLLHVWPVKSNTWCDSRVAFSADGKLLACGENDHNVVVIDVEGGAQPFRLTGHINVIRDLVFSPNGDWLASAGEMGDQTVRIWSVHDQRTLHVLKGHSNAVYSLAVNAKGTLLASGSNDGAVRLWDTSTWTEVGVLKHGSNVYGLAFTPDGARLAAACSDNSVRIWDVQKCEEVADLRGPASYVHSVSFSPDGTRLVAASGDRSLRIWDSLRVKMRR